MTTAELYEDIDAWAAVQAVESSLAEDTPPAWAIPFDEYDEYMAQQELLEAAL